jgi:hypothetical protein
MLKGKILPEKVCVQTSLFSKFMQKHPISFMEILDVPNNNNNNNNNNNLN